MGDVRLRVIVGPTAAGKSALAFALARASGATIVSADSRQVYRGFDIGTAKPSPNELAEVPHVGIDVAEPNERYSAARFAMLARAAIADCAARGRDVVIVGGTGFYVRALLDPLFPEPAFDESRRKRVQNYLDSLDSDTLQRWGAALDPARNTLGRTQRLRAIEVALLSGKRLSEQFHGTSGHEAIDARYLLVDPGAALGDTIARRVDDMFRRGWVEEVRRLAAVVPSSAPAWKGTGYDVLRRYVEGSLDLDLPSVRARVIVATRQYAKRQRTWFRHQLRGDMQTLDPNEAGALDRALAWW